MSVATDLVTTSAPAGFHTLRVARVERLCDDAAAVTFDVPDGLRETYAFRPGQYLTLRLFRDGREERRSYSICAPEGAAPRIGVRRVDTGLFSTWLVDRLTAGDEIEVGPPQGRFSPPVDGAHGVHHVLVAAGSGITPVLSIAATVLAAHADTHVTLLYGNRRSDTVMFGEDLADLKDRYGPRLQLVHVLSREPTAVDLFNGRLDADRLRTLIGALVPVGEVAHWWLCGPLGMVEDAGEVLTGFGVPRAQVHRELFYVDEPPPEVHRSEDDVVDDGTGSAVTIVLNGRASVLTLPRTEPVLDAAQKVRSDLPFACKGGVCGTCRAKVVEGSVAMDVNYALEPDEVAQGYVLTCQSHPTAAKVVLDYDA